VTEGAPRVFLSSTIRDLSDLRSAVKFWLEEFGFQVLTSETTDFPHPLDRETIAAAMTPIADCDYYIVIVGARVGHVVPEKGISATRAEFQHARQLHRATGRPQMLHLVRTDVLEARRHGTDPVEIETQDWTRIRDFIGEVETEEVPGDPNWIHGFASFRDIVDILRATLRLSGPLRRRALEANLSTEIVDNTRELLYRTPKGIGVKALRLTKDHVPLGPPRHEQVWVDYPGTFFVFEFRMSLPRMATLSRAALDEALYSGLFLEYNARLGASIVGGLQRSLLDLRSQLLRLEGLVAAVNDDEGIRQDVARCAEAARLNTGGYVGDLTTNFLHAARDAMDNVLRLNRTLYCHLAGLEPALERPALLPANPHGDGGPAKREDVNRREAVTWLRLTSWPDQTFKRTAEEAALQVVEEEELKRLDEAEDAGWTPA
jgi:hypothetical protein